MQSYKENTRLIYTERMIFTPKEFNVTALLLILLATICHAFPQKQQLYVALKNGTDSI